MKERFLKQVPNLILLLSAIALVLMIISATAQAQTSSQCAEGLEDCKFIDVMVFEIRDEEGTVVDRTTYERLVPISYENAMLQKYLRMSRQINGGAKSFLDVLKFQRNPEAALRMQQYRMDNLMREQEPIEPKR